MRVQRGPAITLRTEVIKILIFLQPTSPRGQSQWHPSRAGRLRDVFTKEPHHVQAS